MSRGLSLSLAFITGCGLTTLDLGGRAVSDTSQDAATGMDGSTALSDAGTEAADDGSTPAAEAGSPDAKIDGGPRVDATSEASNDAGPLPPAGIRDVATGGTFTCVLRNDGAARCFGSNGYGELGVAPEATTKDCDSVPCDFFPRSSEGLRGIAQLTLGDHHGCMIDVDDAVSCWGSNRVGELGRGTSDADPHEAPMQLPTFGDGVKAIAAGYHHTCMIREGKVYCWGLNHLGQLGKSTPTTCTVNDAALLSDLGLSGPSVPCSSEPVEVPGFSGAYELYVFGDKTCARDGGSVLRCWGANGVGELALPPSKSVAPTSFVNQSFEAFALGGTHGCGTFDAAERLRCWGSHATGQLGVGSTALETCGGDPCTATPTVLAELPSARALALGDQHSCALLSNGTVKCWGSDEHEQLGDSTGSTATCGSTSCAKTPVEVIGLADVKLLRSGRSHSCVLRVDGKVLCWGKNDQMQINKASRDDVAHAELIYGLD